MQSAALVLLSQQQALQRSMDIVANNVANSNTTAFKRVGIDFSSMVSKPAPGESLDMVIDRGTHRDTTGGPIQSTGNQLDLAIQGPGYFEVRGQDGTPRYTRNGSLEINNQGQISTLAGLPILGEGGQAITIPETASELNISSGGVITARTDNTGIIAQLGKIDLVKFSDEQKLQAEGGGLYSTTDSPVPADTSSIVQGGLEQSNVQAVAEMSTMIEVSRSYERVTNLISQETSRQSDAITKLSKTTV